LYYCLVSQHARIFAACADFRGAGRHLTLNVPNYYSNQNQRDLVVGLADYLAKKLETLRPEEASAARVLRDLVKNQRLG